MPDAKAQAKGDELSRKRLAGTKRLGSSTRPSKSPTSGESESPMPLKAIQSKPRSTRESPKAPKSGSVSSPSTLQAPRGKQNPQHPDSKAVSKWTRLASAEKKLKEAAKKLEGLLPPDLVSSQETEMESVKGSADINAISESLGTIVEALMRDRHIVAEKETQTGLSLIKIWVKKALPFVEHGLHIAKVPAFTSVINK